MNAREKNPAAFLRRHKRLSVLLAVVLALLIALVLFHPKGTKTFLVLGMDNYGSLNDTGRSDVMMLLQVDFTKSKISAVTFARDMIVNPGTGERKINAVVRSDGEEGISSLLEELFGVKVDGWFRVNFTTIIELVDALGGAQVELTAEEVAYLDRQCGKYPDAPLTEGLSRLNGAQALAYARCRKLDNDMGRGQRQNKLLEALVQSTKKLTLTKLVNVFNSLKHAWQSSYSAGEQVSLLYQALWLRGAKVEKIGVPFEGTWRYGNSNRGESGVIADTEKNRELLLEALGR
ncbi:MAG: LCP family protein [Clostridia bacterium]|nr:LCP family protein [Clostridia bacterium]